MKLQIPAAKISYLEKTTPPAFEKPKLEINSCSPVPSWYFLAYYKEIGRDYFWYDRLNEAPDALDEFCADPAKRFYTLHYKGAPMGFYMLDHTKADETDLAYFGLTTQAMGLRVGSKLLDHAISTAFSERAIKKLTVNTCSLDHERALPLYLSRGFVVVRVEEKPAT